MLSISGSQDTAVKLSDLTNSTIDGSGVFDVLMRSVKAHIEQEWAANRIKGTEYSTVYMSALQATLQASIQFLLSQEKTNAEIALIKQQTLNAAQDNLVVTNQAAKVAQETLFIAQKVITEKAQVDATVIGAGSPLDRQNTVYLNQASGFIRDAEQKAAKIMAEVLNVRTTALDDGGDYTVSHFTDADIGSVITKLKSGIGA
jgi:hypothetical protein